MITVDVKEDTYIDSSKETNDKDPESKIGDHVRISRYKNIFARGYTKLYIKWRGYDNSLIVGLTKNI